MDHTHPFLLSIGAYEERSLSDDAEGSFSRRKAGHLSCYRYPCSPAFAVAVPLSIDSAAPIRSKPRGWRSLWEAAALNIGGGKGCVLAGADDIAQRYVRGVSAISTPGISVFVVLWFRQRINQKITE
ncbi:hypothetical protein BHE74_00028657 [Ensete ventricosum]|nr:hypothetical protein GW17_00010457 [Ensete ventricosum]RWW64137.1 hypothetical protein BHE74_00028657 [Ensete ventricosum]